MGRVESLSYRPALAALAKGLLFPQCEPGDAFEEPASDDNEE